MHCSHIEFGVAVLVVIIIGAEGGIVTAVDSVIIVVAVRVAAVVGGAANSLRPRRCVLSVSLCAVYLAVWQIAQLDGDAGRRHVIL